MHWGLLSVSSPWHPECSSFWVCCNERNYKNTSLLCANFPFSLSGCDYKEVQEMLMTLTIKNVSDFWTATWEKQLKVKTCSGTWVAMLEWRMKSDKVSWIGDTCTVLCKASLPLLKPYEHHGDAAFNSDDSDVFQDLIMVFLDWNRG